MLPFLKVCKCECEFECETGVNETFIKSNALDKCLGARPNATPGTHKANRPAATRSGANPPRALRERPQFTQAALGRTAAAAAVPAAMRTAQPAGLSESPGGSLRVASR